MSQEITFTSRVVASHSQFTEADVIDIIGQDTYDRYKRDQPGGCFKAYVLCHEGRPKPVIGGKAEFVDFGRDAMQSAYEALKRNTRLFWTHKGQGSVDREDFGHVVGKDLREIDGVSSTIMVAHHPADKVEAASRANGVSMEAAWKVARDTFGKLRAFSVSVIDGIAIFMKEPGISPGFQNSGELAQVAAHTTEEEPKKEGKRKMPETEEEEMTFGTLKKTVRMRNVWPTDLYDASNIIGKRIIGEDGSATWANGDRKVAEEIEQSIVLPLVARHNAAIKKKDDEISILRKKVAGVEALPRLEELAKNNYPDLSPAARKLAEKKLKNFDPGDDMDASIKGIIEASKIEDKELIELYGTPPAAPNTPSTGAGGGSSAGTDDEWSDK